MQKSTLIQLSPTVPLKICRKVKDRASYVYFIDKVFAFYVPKTSFFASLSISFIHWEAIRIKGFECIGRIDFYLSTDYIFYFPQGFLLCLLLKAIREPCTSFLSQVSHHQWKLQSKPTFVQYFCPTYSEYVSVHSCTLQLPLPQAQLSAAGLPAGVHIQAH